MARCFVSLALIAASCCLIYLAQEGATYQYNPYAVDGQSLSDKVLDLNKVLVDGTDSRDPEANFKVMEGYTDFSMGSSFAQIRRLFLALNNIRTGIYKCSPVSIGIIIENNRALEKTKLRCSHNKDSCSTRMEKVVDQIAKQHAEECQNVYPQKYKQIIEKMDKTQLSHVETFLRDIVVASGNRLIQQITGDDMVFKNLPPRFFFATLTKLAKDDREAKYLRRVEDERYGIVDLDSDKFTKLFNKYLVEPCIYYIEQLGPEVFELAEVDAQSIRPSMETGNEEYLKGWARYRACKEYQLLKAPEEVINYAKSLLPNLTRNR